MAEFQDAMSEHGAVLRELSVPDGFAYGPDRLERAKVVALISIAKSLEIIAAKP